MSSLTLEKVCLCLCILPLPLLHIQVYKYDISVALQSWIKRKFKSEAVIHHRVFLYTLKPARLGRKTLYRTDNGVKTKSTTWPNPRPPDLSLTSMLACWNVTHLKAEWSAPFVSLFYYPFCAPKRLCFHIYDNAGCLCSFNHALYWKPHKYGSYPALYLRCFMCLSESFIVFRGKLSAWPWHIRPKLTPVCFEELKSWVNSGLSSS